MIYKKIYFVGIKGVGMAALAVLLKQAGYIVSGCDVADTFISDNELKSAEISIDMGFDPSHLVRSVEETSSDEVLLITTAAHGGMGNPIVMHAKKMDINVVTYAQALGKTMSGELLERSDIQGISVAGAHGKTTIAALLAASLSLLGFDPSFVVGTGAILPIGSAGHYGKGDYFVAESDEYASDISYDPVSKFLYQHPQYLILNNIDFDHPDFFKNIDEVKASFAAFAAQVDPLGIIFVNGDESSPKELAEKNSSSRIITYGANPSNDYILKDFVEHGLSSTFTVETQEMKLGEFSLSVPGYHNAKNALSVIAFLVEIGVSIQKIGEVLPQFKGTKRRIEIIGETSHGALVLDDYAHHPKEIKTTLSAIHGAYPSKKIVLIFQPHTYSRTKALLSEFVGSFQEADTLIILPIYASAREDNGDIQALENEMERQFKMISRAVTFLKDAQSVVQYVNREFSSSDFVIVTMGAGDVYKIGYNLVASSK